MPQSQTTHRNFITAIKAFTDNYIWAITTNTSNTLVLVDPGDAAACINYIEENNLRLSAILVTHHHADHTGGIAELKDYCSEKKWSLDIFAPKNESIPHATKQLVQDDAINLASLNLSINVIELPGHTLGHIAYYYSDVLFCGDTLFSGGCGRLFEGSPEQMLSSLNKLKSLPASTRVYCTHEYTLANLEFALTVDPTNLELIEYYNKVKQQRIENKITLPSSILQEQKINPFLRCFDENIQKSVIEYQNTSIKTELSTFTALRKWKDNF